MNMEEQTHKHENRIAALRNNTNQQKYLTFTIEDEVYGIEILKVKEIIAMIKITQVPLVPPFVKGVINLRGQVIPVIDIRLKLGLSEIGYTMHTTIIIVEIDELSIGFIVDRTSDVVSITPEVLSPPPRFGTQIDVSFLKSMAKLKDKIVMIVNLEKIFSQEELDSLNSLE
jgi:purine-binding chemotaxis protein CheW